MTIRVNGEAREVPDRITVADLIRLVGLGSAACAAEVNRSLVPRTRHSETPLSEGDSIELVSLVGGG